MEGITLVRAAEKKPLPEKTAGEVNIIEIRRIVPNPNQPRKHFERESILALADSIHRHGIIMPLTVRRTERFNEYELIAGERRLRAARVIGLREVPCIIMEADVRESAEIALIENILREDLGMFEQAEAVLSLINTHGYTQQQAARRLSVSQSCIANKLRILRFSEEERRLINENALTERHARSLLRIPDPVGRRRALENIIRRKMNVAACEEYIDGILAQNGSQSDSRPSRTPTLKSLYTSIDRAVASLQNSGIEVQSHRVESENGIDIVIHIAP